MFGEKAAGEAAFFLGVFQAEDAIIMHIIQQMNMQKARGGPSA